MRIKVLVTILLLSPFFIKSQVLNLGNRLLSPYKRVAYDISTDVSIYEMEKKIHNKNNISFTYFIPYVRSHYHKILNNLNYGIGIGINEVLDYNIRGTSIYTINKDKKAYGGLVVDYFIKHQWFSVNLHFRKDILLHKLKYDYNLFFKAGVSYLSGINRITPCLGLGLNAEKYIYYRKPVVYFYPKDTMDLEVILDFKGKFTFTWPLYRDKWKIKIYPDSKIFNISDGKYYGYLFWEGTYATPSIDTIKTGFIVEKNEMASFLNEKLSFIGLNDRETNDFITYWVPLLKSDKYLGTFSSSLTYCVLVK